MQIVLSKCLCNVDAAAASGYGRCGGKEKVVVVVLVTCELGVTWLLVCYSRR